jgi:ribosomal protein S12
MYDITMSIYIYNIQEMGILDEADAVVWAGVLTSDVPTMRYR